MRALWKVLSAAALLLARLSLAGSSSPSVYLKAVEAFSSGRDPCPYLKAVASSEGELSPLASMQMVEHGCVDKCSDAVFGLLKRALGSGVPSKLRDRASELLAEWAECSKANAAAARKLAKRLPVRMRRKVLLGVSKHERGVLVSILRRSQGDMVALEAAERLTSSGGYGPKEAYLAAKAYYRHGFYSKALELLRRNRWPRGRKAWERAYLIGRCYLRLGRYDKARKWFKRALGEARSSSDKARSMLQVSRCWEVEGKFKKALRWTRRASNVSRLDWILLSRIRLEFAVGSESKGLSLVAKVRERRSRRRAQVLVALNQLHRGKLEAALGSFEAAGLPEADVEAAFLALALGRSAKALELLAKASRKILDPYWQWQSISLLGGIPESLLGGKQPREWLSHVADTPKVSLGRGGNDPPVPDSGLGGALWELGLAAEAALWDPASFPASEAGEALWSAEKLLELGVWREGILLADRAAQISRYGFVAQPLWPRRLLAAYYPLPLREEVLSAARSSGVPWDLLAAVVWKESKWDPAALSSAGARGLTQLMPSTLLARCPTCSPDDAFRPDVALRVGAEELSALLDMFQGRVDAALAAYNAGQDVVKAWLRLCPDPCTEREFILSIPFAETRGYVADVLAASQAYRILYGTGGER